MRNSVIIPLTFILFISLPQLFNQNDILSPISEIEKQLILAEQLSKISEIESIDKEIKIAVGDKEQKVNSDGHGKPNTTQEEQNHMSVELKDRTLSSEVESQSKPQDQHLDSSRKSQDSSKNKTEMKINSNLHILGSISANKAILETAEITGNARIGKTLHSKEITSDKLTTQTLITDRIVSPTGVITLEGDLIINNDVLADSVSLRGESFLLNGVKQFGLIHHDDFDTPKSLDGWSDKRISRCKEGGNAFLGGHCNLSYTEVSKTFKNLPKHETLRVNAAYHMLDSWDGETAYMKINGEIVWSKRGQHSEKGINLCGGEFNDPAFNM
jgi:hypothetical protein